MRHFEAERWFDLARGAVGDSDRLVMEEHVASGCVRCVGLLSAARRAIDREKAAGSVGRLSAPGSWQRAPQGDATWVAALEALPFDLVYDSSRHRPSHAARYGQTTGRHALYESGGMLIHLWVHEERGRGVIVGQIAARAAGASSAGAPVWLLAGRSEAGRTRCNDHGEFQLEYVSHPQLMLAVPLEDGRSVKLPVPQVEPFEPRR